MIINDLLSAKNISKYRLSKESAVPYTTINDLCNGKTQIEKCSAETVYKIAKVLNVSMEYIMSFDTVGTEYDKKTGLPQNKKYLECGLPPYLQNSLENMKKSWKIEDSGKRDIHWDIYWCDLNADINSAEVDQEISAEQAWYLREKYLRMKRGE